LCVGFLIGVLALTGMPAGGAAEQNADTKKEKIEKAPVLPWETERERRRRAANSLWRLKRAIRRDGYFSARVALNIWRCNAEDAGGFDEEQYEKFKKAIYRNSLDNTLKWFKICIRQRWINEARYCRRLYYFQSHEISAFDPEQYARMAQRIAELKTPDKKEDAKKDG
jgi:hypothetical protein